MNELSNPDLIQVIAAGLFAIGVFGVLARRNLLIILMSVELMLNAANLSLVGFSREAASLNVPGAAESGQVMVLMAMAVAAAEVAVGLSILIAIFRHIRTVDVDADRATVLRG